MELALVAVAAGFAVALPTRGMLRLRARGRADLAPWSRVACAGLAATTMLGALVLDRWADASLAAHMLQHLLLGDVVPLLLVLATRGPLRVHVLPPALGRALALAARPLPAFAAWAGALAVWHVPALYDAALADARLHALEHGCFLTAGLLVWSVLLEGGRRPRLAGWRRFGYALALLAASGALANVLVLSYRPLYPAYAGATARPLGLSAVSDQDLAGIVMMLEQLATVGSLAAIVARRQLQLAAPSEAVARHPLAA